MINYILNVFRKVLKSIGKKENTLIDLITYLDFKKNYEKFNSTENNLDLNKESNLSIKFAATIVFLYDEKKIKLLKNVCESLYNISKNSHVFIITNNISKKNLNNLKKKIKFKNNNIHFIINKNLINNRFLPWCHIPIMKKIYSNKTYRHTILV